MNRRPQILKIQSLVIFFMAVIMGKVYAQDAGIQKVIEELRHMQAAYDAAHTLSFNIEYKYTNETTPTVILDSVAGFMQVSNHRYHWLISNTEMMTNDRYVIMLFKDDRIMYITKPSQAYVAIDPVNRLDSALLQIKGVQCSVQKTKDFRIIKIVFPEGSRYKSIQFFINNSSGYLAKAQYVVQSEALTADGTLNEDDRQKYEAYALIEARYFNYKTDAIAEPTFSEDSYFTKQDKNFTTTPLYKEYKIFIGSPNL